jgi:hypothetical protein
MVSARPIFCQSVHGLGNDLFILATALEQARRLRTDVVMYYWAHKPKPDVCTLDLPVRFVARKWRPELRRLSVGLSRRLPHPTLARLFVEREFQFESGINAVRPGDELVGFFQSPKYFPNSGQLLRAALLGSFVEDRDHLASESRAVPGLLSIHLRLGDYTGDKEAVYHGIPSTNYFLRGLSLATRTKSIDRVRVHTDSPEQAKQRFQRLFLELERQDLAYELIGPQDTPTAVAALVDLSDADWLLLSNSTFSWWAAYLRHPRRGLVIFPRPWFRSGAHNTDDLLLPEWATLGADYGI